MAAAVTQAPTGTSTVGLVEPEVHVIGEIVGGSCFTPSTSNAFCIWQIITGQEWLCVGGMTQGQTQVDYPEDGEMCIWNHPLDVHYYTKSLQGWPKVVAQVWKLDDYGGKQLFGYGFCYIPSSPGCHELEIDMWRPVGTPKEEVYDFFLGGVPNLLTTELIHNTTKAKEDRCHLYTTSVGKLHIRVDVILRNIKQHQVQ